MTYVIHKDVNARRQDYRNLQPDQVLVTKMFPTIQGEGPLAGQFAIFLRLAGCNIGAKTSCPWCDTEFHLKKGIPRLIDELCLEAEAMRPPHQKKLVVLTGGEPFLQNPSLLIERFLSMGWTVQVETNGYFYSEQLADLYVNSNGSRFLIVLSPKANIRGEFPVPDERLLVDAHCLKLVVDSDPTSPYHNVPSYVKAFQELHKPVYVSPINHYWRQPLPGEIVSFWQGPIDTDRCRANYRYASSLVYKYGFIISLQTHLLLEAE